MRKKVFPEDLQLYEHSFFTVGKNKILSVLVRQSIKEKIEELVDAAEINLIHMGNSTIEIIDNISWAKSCPDFFIEVDNHLAIVVFLNNFSPYYIRKFRIDSPEDISPEILKTLNFVKGSYSMVPNTYALFANAEDFQFDMVKEQLNEAGLAEPNMKFPKKIIFPG